MAADVLKRWKILALLLVLPFMVIMVFTNVLAAQGRDSYFTTKPIADEGFPGSNAILGPSVIATTQSSNTLSCRNGVVAIGSEQEAWVENLGAGWYVYFGGVSEAGLDGPESVSIIHVTQKKDGNGDYLDDYIVVPQLTEESLGAILEYYPGRLWMIGNEVDRGPNPGGQGVGQGDIYPQVYARAYHDVYKFIKEHDPTAQVAISGLVEVTPGRLQYLEIVWDSYHALYGAPMPVDVWNMHLYILPEVLPDGTPNGIANVALGTNPSLGIRESGNNPSLCSRSDVYCFAEHDDLNEFDLQVRAMRKWMLNHGQQKKPLLLSEFSILYPYIDEGETCYLQDEYGECFTPNRVVQFLNNTMSYFNSAVDPEIGNPLDNYRLIQQTAWFSINNDGKVGDVSNLVDREYSNAPLASLSLIGDNFVSILQSEEHYVNLVPDQPDAIAAHTNTPTNTTDVNLEIEIANNGNTPLTQTFKVSFYKDISPKKEITSVLVSNEMMPQGVVAGCGRRLVNLQVEWSGLSPGVHPYWVEVDSENQINEGDPGGTGEEDNLTMGLVLVDQEQAYLPVFRVAYRASQ